jgi:Mrp family chromosome partitioning ATPase
MRARSSLKTTQAYMASLEDAEIPAWEVDQYALADPTSRDLQLKLSYYNTTIAQATNFLVPGRKLPPSVQKIQSDKDVVQQQIDEIGKGYRDKIRERKRSEAEKDIRKLEAEVAVLTDQEQHFQADTEQQRKEVEKIGGQSIEIEMDRAKLKNIEEVLASVASERERLRVELMSAPRVNAIGKCEEPKEEYRRGMRLAIIGLAGILGFCMPVLGVMLWDVRSRRVNAVSEVARGLGLSVIGSVPTIPAQVLRRLGSDSKRSQVWRLRLTESIDGITARLLHKAERDQARVVLVSSAMPGEGKTTLATQLAMSLARHLRRTVLVDFDLRRPTLDGIFGVPLEPGVCDALCGRGDVAGMIQPTGTDCLSVLPAGRWGREAMAALANGGGGPLFKQLREKYDFVIIDSSPVLPVADTRFVSQHADTVVLSVFRDVSEVPKIQATCEILDAFGVRDLEAVVTGGAGFSYGRGRQYQAGATA